MFPDTGMDMSKEQQTLNQPQLEEYETQQAPEQLPTDTIDGPDVLARAEALIETLKEDFLIWLTTELETIESIQERWKEDGVDDKGIDHILRTLHDLHAQSITFGYPVITHLSTTLKDHLTTVLRESERFIPLVEMHTSALQSATATAFRAIDSPQSQRLAKQLAAKKS